MESRFYYFDHIIRNLKVNAKSEKKDHYLFLLGTEVNYVAQPETVKDENNPNETHNYTRGETLSYAAQLTSLLLNEQINTQIYAQRKSQENTSYAAMEVRNRALGIGADPHYAHAYHSDSVDIVNGPDTPGFEVGQRIAKALLIALSAISTGKTHLKISGFSRGSVEAIMLTHELNRIRHLLEDDSKQQQKNKRSLASIIKDSTSVPGVSNLYYKQNSYTHAVLTNLVNDEKIQDEEEIKSQLLENLNQLDVKLFVIDPVPGGFIQPKLPMIGTEGIPLIPYLGWQEKKFYSLPAFVGDGNKIQFLQKHETSNCFKPIIPEGMPYEILPGIHGTSDGNQRDHNGRVIPKTIKHRDVSGVQNLVICRWIDFMFPPETVISLSISLNQIQLGHPELDALVNEYLFVERKKRDQILLGIYHNILENMEAFEYLGTQNYDYLGKNHRLFSRIQGNKPIREVHYHKRARKLMSVLDTHGDGKHFLNLQHVELWISSLFDKFNVPNTLDQQIHWLNNLITDPLREEAKDDNLTDSRIERKHLIQRLLSTNSNQPLVVDAICMLIHIPIQAFFRNQLTDDELGKCKKYIEETLIVLEQVAKSGNSLSGFSVSLKQNIHHKLTRSLLEHQDQLLFLTKEQLESFHKCNENENLNESQRQELKKQWLINTKNLLKDLQLLGKQIDQLDQWCERDVLSKHWKSVVLNSENKIGSNDIKAHPIDQLDDSQNWVKVNAENEFADWKKLIKEHIIKQDDLLNEKRSQLLDSQAEYTLITEEKLDTRSAVIDPKDPNTTDQVIDLLNKNLTFFIQLSEHLLFKKNDNVFSDQPFIQKINSALPTLTDKRAFRRSFLGLDKYDHHCLSRKDVDKSIHESSIRELLKTNKTLLEVLALAPKQLNSFNENFWLNKFKFTENNRAFSSIKYRKHIIEGQPFEEEKQDMSTAKLLN